MVRLLQKPVPLSHLVEVAYPELLRMAAGRLSRERRWHRWEPAALVHEAYIRLDAPGRCWVNPGHFFGTWSETMRLLLIDDSRRPLYASIYIRIEDLPGGDLRGSIEQRSIDQLAMDASLRRLAIEHRRLAVLAKLMLLGFTQDEAASRMGIALRTAKRDVRACRTWLANDLHAIAA